MLETAEKQAEKLQANTQVQKPSIPDLAAFLASLPDLTQEESEAFEQAITENRAHRRALVKEAEC